MAEDTQADRWKVAVVGGGISGLSAAHHLAGAGAEVVLYEASSQLGGLATFFEYEEHFFERFYHCMLPSDDDLLGLMRDVGVEDRVYWKETHFGYLDAHHRIYPLDTASDLLRFSPVSPIDRLRIGWAGLYASLASDKGLDEITTADWLTKRCGRRAFEAFFKPLLEAKFGEFADQIPALWFWTRFNREKGGKKETKGYIRGGYKALADAIAGALQRRGVHLRLETPVDSVDLTEDGLPAVAANGESTVFDQVLLATPLPLASKLLGEGRLAECCDPESLAIESVGVVNLVLLLTRKLTDYYWLAIPAPEIPFQGIVETTTLIEPDDSASYHVVNLMNYAHRSSVVFETDDDSIVESWLSALVRIFPDLEPAHIRDRFLFKAPFVEPVYQTNYLKRKPPSVLAPGRVYLATTAQVYPVVTAWNGVSGLARSVAETMIVERNVN